MPGTTKSEAALAVASKYEDLAGKHNNSISEVEELHDAAIQEVLPAVLQELHLVDDAEAIGTQRAFLDDRGA